MAEAVCSFVSGRSRKCCSIVRRWRIGAPVPIHAFGSVDVQGIMEDSGYFILSKTYEMGEKTHEVSLTHFYFVKTIY